MKKLIALLLALVMILRLVACGKTDEPAVDAPATDVPAADVPAADAPGPGCGTAAGGGAGAAPGGQSAFEGRGPLGRE